MTVTSLTGPLVSVGQPPAISGMPGDYNSDLGPSMFWGGPGFLDLRGPNQASASSAGPMFYGYSASSRMVVIDQVPTALSATNIAASQVPVAGTAMTLASASVTGVTVQAAGVVVPPSMTVLPAVLAIDTAAATVTYGTSTAVSLYSPATALSRNLRFTSTADESAGTVAIIGYDIYGYIVHETVTLANNGIASSKKAIKYLASITPGGTLSGTAITVGTGDVIGFPIRVDTFPYVQIYYAATNPTLITSATGFTAAVTSTATATTGDVRGTYALQTSSNTSIRLVMFITPSVANLGTAAGLWGVTQF